MNLNYGYKKYNITFTGSFMHAHLPSQQSDTAQRKRMVSYRKSDTLSTMPIVTVKDFVGLQLEKI